MNTMYFMNSIKCVFNGQNEEVVEYEKIEERNISQIINIRFCQISSY